MASSLAIYKEDREKLWVKAAPLLPKGCQVPYCGATCLLGQGWGRGREAAVPDLRAGHGLLLWFHLFTPTGSGSCLKFHITISRLKVKNSFLFSTLEM